MLNFASGCCLWPVSGRSQVRTGLAAIVRSGEMLRQSEQSWGSLSANQRPARDTGHCSGAVVEVSSVCDVSRAGLTLGEH